MRILLLADGGSVHTSRYQAELKKLGIEVHLASLESGETVDVQLKRLTPFNSLNYALSSREVRKLVERFRPDVVDAHFASGYGFTAALSGVGRGVPVVVHCLGSDVLISPGKSILHKKRVVYALSKAKVVFVDSRFLAERVRKLRPSANLHIIPWGVEEELVKLFDISAKGDFRVRRPLCVIVPRPHNEIYNNQFIIQSLSQFVIDGKITLAFPSWGNGAEKFREAIDRGFPGGGVTVYDFMPREEYFKYLAGFDVYLSAALSDSAPASLLEAMAAGLFPVVGDIPGVREWVDDSNGMLFSLTDKVSLRTAFTNLLIANTDIADILVRNNQRVRESAMFTDNIKKTISIMEEAVTDAR